MQSTHGFHHGIDGIISQNILIVFGNLRIRKGHILQTQYPGNFNVRQIGGEIINASTDNTEAKQTNSHV